MSKLSITQAADFVKISRSYFYKKYINTGVISIEIIDGKKFIDISELLRVFPNVSSNVSNGQYDTLEEKGNKDYIIALLERELADTKAQAKEREEWLKQQIDDLRRQQANILEDKIVKPKRKKFLGIF